MTLDRLLAAPLARGARLARAGAAVALRRRLPRARVLGRPRRRARPCCRPAWSRTPTTPAARRRCSSTGSRARSAGDELLDPARSQYKEFFIVVNALLDGERGHDLPVHLGRPRLRAGARLDPGLPEEARLDLDDALLRPRLQRRPGRRPRRRLRRHAGGQRPPAGRGPRDDRARGRRAGRRTTTRRWSTAATSRAWPPAATTSPRWTSWCAPAAATARSRRSGRGRRDARAASGAPNEEHVALAPVRMGKGFRFTFAYTVDDLETVGDLEAG